LLASLEGKDGKVDKKIIPGFALLVALLAYPLIVVEPVLSQANLPNQVTPQALCRAIEKGDINAVRRLLDAGIDANAINIDGIPPLTTAAAHSSVEITTLLLERGANVNTRQGYLREPLAAALAHDSLAVAALLLDHGADINFKCGGDNNAFRSVRSWEGMKLLIHRGIQLTRQDLDRALYIAVYSVDPQRVEFLLGKGANANQREGPKCTTGMTPREIRNYRGPTLLTIAKEGLALAQKEKPEFTARCKKVVQLLKHAGGKE
jgi:hypothetical protein